MSRSGGGAVLSPCPAPGRFLGSGLQASHMKDKEKDKEKRFSLFGKKK